MCEVTGESKLSRKLSNSHYAISNKQYSITSFKNRYLGRSVKRVSCGTRLYFYFRKGLCTHLLARVLYCAIVHNDFAVAATPLRAPRPMSWFSSFARKSIERLTRLRLTHLTTALFRLYTNLIRNGLILNTIKALYRLSTGI